MKKNIIIIMFAFIILFSLTSCSTNKKTINGRYTSTIDNTIYCEFSNDGSYITNNNWDMSADSSSGSYNITDNKLVVYASGNENYSMYIGTIYNDYICSVWEGDLPEEYDNTTITNKLADDFILSFVFNKDKSYEYTVTSNNNIVFSESGKYSISDNNVICTSNSNTTSTFFKDNNIVYCIEYIKE